MTGLILAALVAADVARCESGDRLDDAAAVLAVASGRALDSGRGLLAVLTERHQFAFGCPASPRTLRIRHLIIGAKAALGIVEAPVWAFDARFYCGPSDTPGACHERRSGPVGSIVHTFYRGYVGGPPDDPE